MTGETGGGKRIKACPPRHVLRERAYNAANRLIGAAVDTAVAYSPADFHKVSKLTAAARARAKYAYKAGLAAVAALEAEADAEEAAAALAATFTRR